MKENKRIIKFLLVVLGLVATWFVLYDIWLSSFDELLTLKIASASGWVLNLVGYGAVTHGSSIFINGEELVYVGPACNAMVLMALFTGFIIAFPGPLVKKLFYIPLGIIIINLLNVLRVTILTLNALYSGHTLEFNHKYTFTFVVYACIFGLWMLWVKKFSHVSLHAPATTST